MSYDPKNRSQHEQDAFELWDAMIGNEDEDVPVYAAALAAAEERGRQRGVEEAAKICDEERETAWGLSRLADARGDHRVGAADAHTAATAQRLADAIRALAPRDSGKEG